MVLDPSHLFSRWTPWGVQVQNTPKTFISFIARFGHEAGSVFSSRPSVARRQCQSGLAMPANGIGSHAGTHSSYFFFILMKLHRNQSTGLWVWKLISVNRQKASLPLCTLASARVLKAGKPMLLLPLSYSS